MTGELVELVELGELVEISAGEVPVFEISERLKSNELAMKMAMIERLRKRNDFMVVRLSLKGGAATSRRTYTVSGKSYTIHTFIGYWLLVIGYWGLENSNSDPQSPITNPQ